MPAGLLGAGGSTLIAPMEVLAAWKETSAPCLVGLSKAHKAEGFPQVRDQREANFEFSSPNLRQDTLPPHLPYAVGDTVQP
jgi:hypothetical protein